MVSVRTEDDASVMQDETREVETSTSSPPAFSLESVDDQSEELEILQSLGFPPSLSRRGLEHGGGTVTGALDWILDVESCNRRSVEHVPGVPEGDADPPATGQESVTSSDRKLPGLPRTTRLPAVTGSSFQERIVAKTSADHEDVMLLLDDQSDLSSSDQKLSKLSKKTTKGDSSQPGQEEMCTDFSSVIETTAATATIDQVYGSPHVSSEDKAGFLKSNQCDSSNSIPSSSQVDMATETNNPVKPEASSSQITVLPGKSDHDEIVCSDNGDGSSKESEITLGTPIIKYFPGSYSGSYQGFVSKLPSGEACPYYRVQYLDGAEEDMGEEELLSCVNAWKMSAKETPLAAVGSLGRCGTKAASDEREAAAESTSSACMHGEDRNDSKEDRATIGVSKQGDTVAREYSSGTKSPAVPEIFSGGHTKAGAAGPTDGEFLIQEEKTAGDTTRSTAQVASTRASATAHSKVSSRTLNQNTVRSEKRETPELCLSHLPSEMPLTSRDLGHSSRNERHATHDTAPGVHTTVEEEGSPESHDQLMNRSSQRDSALTRRTVLQHPGAFQVPEISETQSGDAESSVRASTSEEVEPQDFDGSGQQGFAVTTAELVVEDETSPRDEGIDEEVQQRVREQLETMVTSAMVSPVTDPRSSSKDAGSSKSFERGHVCLDCTAGRKRKCIFLLAVCVVLGAVLGGIFGSQLLRDDKDRLSPSTKSTIIPLPTLPPTAQSISKILEGLVGDKIYQAGTPYQKATAWMIEYNPLIQEQRNSSLIAQRYLMALLYFSTVRERWTNCFFIPYSEEIVCEAEVQDCYIRARNREGEDRSECKEYIKVIGQRWLSDSHECDWFGIFCPHGDIITEITLPENNLYGTLPSDLAKLSSIEVMSFFLNHLSGTIPSQYGSMPSLTDLELHANMLSGTIPEELYNATQLQRLSLGENILTGTISTRIGNLKKLTRLFLQLTALTGTLPTQVGLLNEMTALWITGTNISGTLPTELGNLQFLYDLNLHSNSFSGALPTEIGRLGDLDYLDVSYNNFTSAVLTEFGQLGKLTFLDVSNNLLEGPLPDELYNASLLSYLNVEINSLSGSISPLLGKLSALEQLIIKENNFTGGLPEELFSLKYLTIFDASINGLKGEIPPEIGELTDLRIFQIFENEVEGEFPPQMSRLTNLELLDVEQNDMIGPLFFDGILDLENLRRIRGSGNAFTGEIPDDIGDLDKLREIWAARTFLEGTIPTSVGQLSVLESVVLYETDIGGELVGELFLSEELEWVDLSNTTVGGPLPDELYGALKLKELIIGSAELTGSIQDGVGDLVEMEKLWLSNNLLTGSIPTTIGDMELLHTLILNQNLLTGEIPTSIGSLSKLQYVDLSQNALSGPIPSSLFEIDSIQIIYLFKNTLKAEIPGNYDNPPDLRNLWIAGNLLTGQVPPPEEGRLENLEEFLFNFNLLTGEVPEGLCELRDTAGGEIRSLHADCAIPPDPPQIRCDADCCTWCTANPDWEPEDEDEDDEER